MFLKNWEIVILNSACQPFPWWPLKGYVFRITTPAAELLKKLLLYLGLPQKHFVLSSIVQENTETEAIFRPWFGSYWALGHEKTQEGHKHVTIQIAVPLIHHPVCNGSKPQSLLKDV